MGEDSGNMIVHGDNVGSGAGYGRTPTERRGWALGLLAEFAGLSLLAARRTDSRHSPASKLVGWCYARRFGQREAQEEKGREERDPALDALRRRFAAVEIS
jgi:hypothetical protein